MNHLQKEKQKITKMTITTTSAAATALSLAAFAFLGVAAISATSMLSPMHAATAQEAIATCVILHGGEGQGQNQFTGPPQVLHLGPGDIPVGEVLPDAACAELR